MILFSRPIDCSCEQGTAQCNQHLGISVKRTEHTCRLKRCTGAITGAGSPLPRVKPFKYTYEKEIVMYAYYQKLDYFSTECVYAPYAARGLAREYVKDVELIRPSAIVDIIKSAEEIRFSDGVYQSFQSPHLYGYADVSGTRCSSKSMSRARRPGAKTGELYAMWLYLQPTYLQGVPPLGGTQHR